MKKLSYLLIVLSIVFIFGTICYADSYETEPNNDKSQANALVSGVPIIGQTSSSKDEDWFYICTSAGDLIQTTFTLEDGKRGWWHISVEDVPGNLLSQVQHWGDVSQVTETKFTTAVTTAGIYYIKIDSQGRDSSYSLTVSISNPGECPTEPPQYDVTGIWQMVGHNYYLSLYITGSTAIAVTYIPGAGESYLLGTISGNIGHINYASDLAQFDATFIFTSATTGTLTVNKCVPFSGEYCVLPVGVPINGIKIF